MFGNWQYPNPSGVEKDPDNRRLEETFRMIKMGEKNFRNYEDLAQAADNIGRSDVAKWIRKYPWKLDLWIHSYIDAYDTPDLKEEDE